MATREGLIEALRLKSVRRAGWVREGVAEPESVADHSWGMAFLATQLCPEDLDLLSVLGMCALHDLAEVRVGDITPHDGIPDEEKRRLESAAIAAMGVTEASRLLVEEYGAQTSAEARFVKMLDKLDMALQSAIHSEDGFDLARFEEPARGMVGEWGLDHLLR